MVFEKSRVFTALNADELKIGSKVIVADDLAYLKHLVRDDEAVRTLEQINGEEENFRFVANGGVLYALAYLISEPEEKKLKWTDLNIGDVIRQKEGTISYLVTGIDTSPSTNKHIFTDGVWCLDSALEEWEKVEE